MKEDRDKLKLYDIDTLEKLLSMYQSWNSISDVATTVMEIENEIINRRVNERKRA